MTFISNFGLLPTMKELTRYFIFILLIFILPLAIIGQGYKIKVKINGISDTTIILGHYFNKSMYPDDTIWVNNKGTGKFKGKNSLPGGMYVIFLPNTKFFELLINDDQKFYVETDTVDFIENTKIKGSDENSVFFRFQKYMKSLSLRAEPVKKMIMETDDRAEKAKYVRDMENINKERTSYIDSIVETNSGTFIAKFLKATVDIVVPDPPKDEEGNVIDSTWQYYYYRNHYFDNFDISDARLLRTPIYENRIMNYITQVVPQIPDSIIPEVDMLIDKAHADSSLFRFMLIRLFNFYGKSNIMGMDAVLVHIAEKYYINESWWSSDKFIEDLKDRINKIKPLLIGAPAQDFELVHVPSQHFIEAINDTALKKFPHIGKHFNLYNVNAEFTVLLFWEADCGHCKKVVPELYNIYQNNLKDNNVKVIAVSTLFGEEGKVKWVDFVNKYKLYNWINAWNPYSYEFKVKYNIMATPQIFLLDRNKNILAKNINPEQTLNIIRTINNHK